MGSWDSLQGVVWRTLGIYKILPELETFNKIYFFHYHSICVPVQTNRNKVSFWIWYLEALFWNLSSALKHFPKISNLKLLWKWRVFIISNLSTFAESYMWFWRKLMQIKPTCDEKWAWSLMRPKSDFSKYRQCVSSASQCVSPAKRKKHTSPIISKFCFWPLLMTMVNFTAYLWSIGLWHSWVICY